jgi:hypothetical protein
VYFHGQDFARFLQIRSILEVSTAHIEREPRQLAWFGKEGFPSSLSTLDEAVARKPFLAMTTINASPGVRSKLVYADFRRSGCVARYGARTRGRNRPHFPEESILLVLCQSILLWEYRAGTSRC